MKVYICIQLFLFIFYKCMKTIKLKQISESNGGPSIFEGKNYTKGFP